MLRIINKSLEKQIKQWKTMHKKGISLDFIIRQATNYHHINNLKKEINLKKMEKITKFSDAWKIYNTKNDWFYCKKKPVIIKAIQMEMPFAVKTLEGTTYEGKAGDYLLEGIKKEVYPCQKEIFEETYKKKS